MKKIMFNDRYGLTEAVLKRRKTMTRRMENGMENLEEGNFCFMKGKKEIELYGEKGTIIETIKPRYKVGEVVAVAQSYNMICTDFEKLNEVKCMCGRDVTKDKSWTNKMYVKPYLMPHRIRITDIKVEKLQDISEEDCLKEGIQDYFPYIDRNPNDKVRTFQYFKDGKIRHRISPASKCFAHLIDDISGKGTWERNPWVFAYSLELVK